jgi:hypothetical protein
VLDMTASGTALVDRPAPTCKLTEWKPWQGGVSTLIGHATISLSGGWVVSSIPIFRIDGVLSAGTPSAPELDKEGRQLRERWRKADVERGDRWRPSCCRYLVVMGSRALA